MINKLQKKFTKQAVNKPYLFLVCGVVYQAYIDNDFDFFESELYKEFYSLYIPEDIKEKVEEKIKEKNQTFLLARNAILSVFDSFTSQEKKALRCLFTEVKHGSC